MNKTLYKVIFNKKRGCMMAVAENTLRDGKSTQDSNAGHVSDMPEASFSLKLSQFSLQLILGSAALLSSTVQAAGIAVDTSAPKSQQATVLQTANSLPQVNIQTPTAGGVSVNQYQQFDVQSQGAILNNSRKNTQTQLAGWIQGNPWLSNGEAKVIINQVNSNNPSLLGGYIEVGGKRAEVVMANPAGIQVSGAGFINASGVTLTTGKPVMTNGILEGFQVRQGKVEVSGKGLDTSDSDYTRILSQTAAVNAGIWAKDLSVVAGSNDVKADGSHAASAGNTPSTPYSIDTGSLGGMYAGKITLVSTDKGLGINNAGQIFAGAGGVSLNADGTIVNSGSMIASDQSSHTAATDIQATQLVNSGTLSAQGRLVVKTDHTDNSGLMASDQELHIDNRTDLKNSGEINAVRLDIQTDALHNSGKLVQTGTQALMIDAGQVSNSNGGLIGHTSADTGTSSTTLPAQGTSTPTTATAAGQVGTVSTATDSTQLADGTITVHGSLDNDKGQITGNGPINLTARTGLDNQADLNLQELNVHGSSLNNRQGKLRTSRLNSTAAELHNQGGQITVENELSIDGSLLDNTEGAIVAGSAAHIHADTITNRQGSLSSGTQLDIAAPNSLDNQSGNISANQSVVVDSNSINNHSGTIISTQGDLSVHSQQTSLDNSQGHIQAAGKAELQAAGLNNNNGIIQSNGLTVQLAEKPLDNRQGKLLSQTDMHISSGEADNTQGQIIANKDLSVDSHEQALTNTQGMISSGGHADIQSGALSNQSGSIIAGQSASINTHNQILDNSHTLMNGGIYADNLNIRSSRLDNESGAIGAGSADIQSGEVKNANGQLAAMGDMRLAADHIDNQAGGISSQNLTIQAHAIHNTQNKESDKGGIRADHLSAQTDVWDNSNGLLASNKDMQLAISSSLNNQQGTIASSESLAISSAPSSSLVIQNDQGAIQSQGDMQLTAASLSNSGNIVTNGKLAADIASTLENSGTLSALSDMRLNAAQVSNSGTISTTGTLKAQANSWDNQQGTIEAGILALEGNSLDNRNGHIQQSNLANLAINSGSLNNAHGVLGGGAPLNSQTNTGTTTSGTSGNPASSGGPAGGNAVSSPSGTISSPEDGYIRIAGNLDNSQGHILSNGLTNLSGQGTFSNAEGELNAGKFQWINAGVFDNRSGKINTLSSDVSAVTINNESGQWFAKNTLAANLDEALSNYQGKIISGGDMALKASALNNWEGQIISAASLSAKIDTPDSIKPELDKIDWPWFHEAPYTMEQIILGNRFGGNVDNTGVIAAADYLNIDSKTITNNGQLHGGAVSLETARGLNNQSGSITSDGNLAIQTHEYNLNNSGGVITSQTDADIQVGALNKGLS